MFDKTGLITIVQEKTHHHINVVTLLIPKIVKYLRLEDAITYILGGTCRHLILYIYIIVQTI